MKIVVVLVLVAILLGAAQSYRVIKEDKDKVVPIALFAGFGDECDFPGMNAFTNFFAKELNTTAKCIWIGAGSISSVVMSFEEQGKAACKKLENDPDFSGEFSVVGNSQGGLLARYVVEKCEGVRGRVRNFASFGGPHMGVGKLPHCFNGFICNFINYVIDNVVYFSFIQNNIGPAGYFRDPGHIDYYRSHSIFLPSVNNEVEFDQAAYDGWSSLNKVFLGMFAKDTMIFPAETAWFYELQADGSVLPFNQTQLYLNDTIGLKKLDEQDKLVFHKFPGDHLQFSYQDIREYVFPVLQS